jgi:hypothetical protein
MGVVVVIDVEDADDPLPPPNDDAERGIANSVAIVELWIGREEGGYGSREKSLLLELQCKIEDGRLTSIWAG